MKRLALCLLLMSVTTAVALRAADLLAQASGLPPYKPPAKMNFAPPEAKTDDEAAADDETADGAKSDDAKSEDKAKAAEPPPPETDPLVRAVLDSNPRSPAELVQAASVLVSRKRGVLAKPLVERLLAAQLPPDQLRALARRFGPGPILQLGLAPELEPAGRQFADAVDAAVRTAAADPARIGRLVDQLAGPTLDERRAAAFQLRDIGPPAVAPLVKILADPAQSVRHAQVRAALVAMGDQVVPSLVGVLDSDDPPLEAQVIAVLGQLAPGEAGTFVLGAAADTSPAPLRAAALRALEGWKGAEVSPAEIRETLESEVQHWFHEGRLPAADVNGLVTVWRWDPAQGQSVALEATPRQAADLTAARLAVELAQLDPSERHRRVALVAGLQAFGGGPALDASVAPEELDAALAIALESNRWHAAAALASALGKAGWVGAVAGRSGEPAPLVLATRVPDRALQRAAAEAVLALAPHDTFTGAGAVGETLRFLATGAGVRRAVVAHPRIEDGRNLGAWLVARGYEPAVVATGGAAYRAAVASADVELVLLHEALAAPCACDVIQYLRRDRRTATVPIGLMQLPNRNRSPLDPFERDAFTLAGPTPVEEPIFERFLERLLTKAGGGVTPPEARREQGDFAVAALGGLVETPRAWFDLRSAEVALLARLDQGVLSPNTVRALGALGTPAAQRRLVELVGNPLAPAAERQQALEAFRVSVRRHGILLKTGEIEQQYALYDASQDAEPAEQQLLAALIAAIEATRAAAAAASGN